jgi:hypothetical protein
LTRDHGNGSARRDLGALFAQDELIDRALAVAVRNAVLMHKRLGNPIAGWEGDKVVWIPPDEIEVDESDDEPLSDARP